MGTRVSDFRALSLLVERPEPFVASRPPEPCVHHGDAAPLRALLDFRACDVLLANGGLRVPAVQMARDGNRLPEHHYTLAGLRSREDAMERVSAHAVYRQLQAGATLVLNGLHHLWDPMARFARRLSFELGAPTHVNAYLTPAGAQGFTHHHDVHSVFIAQTEGAKTWQLFRPVTPSPLPGYHEWSTLALTLEDRERLIMKPPDVEMTLRPGDVLWLPRGWVHNGFAEQEASLHMTIGIAEMTRHWLLRQIVDWLAGSDPFREDLDAALGTDAASARAAVGEVISLLSRWAESERLDDVAEFAAARHRSRFQPPRVEPVQATVAAGQAAMPSTVRLCREAVCGVDALGEGSIRLDLGDHDVTLEGDVQGLLAIMRRDGEMLDTRQLLDSLSTDQERTVRALIDEGILVPTAEGGSS